MIDVNSIVWSENCVDPGCRVFFVGNRVFRAYEECRRQETLDFLDSECYAILKNNRMIVNTWISEEVQLDGYPLIVEHERLCCMPEKWLCFEMLKEILAFHFEINRFCNKYGYGLRDIGFGNVTLNRGQLCFIDFGSFRKINIEDSDTYAQYCLPLAWLPLSIYSKNDGNDFVADSMIGDYDKWITGQKIPYGDTLFSNLLQSYLHPIVSYHRIRIFHSLIRLKIRTRVVASCIRPCIRLTNRLVRVLITQWYKGGEYAHKDLVKLIPYYSDKKAEKSIRKIKFPYKGNCLDFVTMDRVSQVFKDWLPKRLEYPVKRVVLWGNFPYDEVRLLRNVMDGELIVMSRDRLYTNHLYGKIRSNGDDVTVICCNAMRGKDFKVLGSLRTDILVLQDKIYEQVHNGTHSDWPERASHFAKYILTPNISTEENKICHLQEFYKLIDADDTSRYQLYEKK